MTTTRPAFDAAGYESPELAEFNRPVHAICWDMIEAEKALEAARVAHVSDAIYTPLETVFLAARKAHNDALDVLDAQVAAYVDRIEAAGGLDAYLGRVEAADESQLALI